MGLLLYVPKAAATSGGFNPSQLKPARLELAQIDLAEQVSQTISPLPANPESPFLQPAPTPAPLEPTEVLPLPIVPVPAPIAPTLPQPQPVEISVTQIQVIGSTVFSEQTFLPLVQPFEGRSLTLTELQSVADTITQLYLDAGYLTSRAVLVDQQIDQGVVQIRVIEGSLEHIQIEGAHRVNPNYIRSRIRLGGKTPVSQSSLEDQLRLLRLDPLFANVEASLRPGSSLGKSILVVRVIETDPFIASAGIDNYSNPSVGSERTTLSLGYRNLTGHGDQVLGTYARSTTGGSNVFDFNYQIPLNPMNGTLQLRAAPSFYTITDPKFAALHIHGNSQVYGLSYRQPLVRSPREEFAVSLGFTYENGETLASSFLTNTSTTSVIGIGQDYVRRDPSGAWAARSQFNIGTGLLGATHHPGSAPDGQFLVWLGQIQRVQILNPNNLLIAQFDLQLTPSALLSSQQFVIGGGQSIRGYRQNARLGDNGFRFSIENRITLQHNDDGAAVLQLAPFADLGTVWNTTDNPNSLPSQTFLAGLGIGVLWEPVTDLNIQVNFALPLVDLSDRGENLQDDGIYFGISWQH